MSPIIYQPAGPHECRPPVRLVDFDGRTSPHYPVGTIWECDDCGQRWELEGGEYPHPAGGSYVNKFWSRTDTQPPKPVANTGDRITLHLGQEIGMDIVVDHVETFDERGEVTRVEITGHAVPRNSGEYYLLEDQ